MTTQWMFLAFPKIRWKEENDHILVLYTDPPESTLNTAYVNFMCPCSDSSALLLIVTSSKPTYFPGVRDFCHLRILTTTQECLANRRTLDALEGFQIYSGISVPVSTCKEWNGNKMGNKTLPRLLHECAEESTPDPSVFQHLEELQTAQVLLDLWPISHVLLEK